MQLTVLSEDGRIFNVTVNDCDTVLRLKSKIKDHFHIPLDEQYLFYNDVIFEDSSSLKRYNLKDYDMVMVRRIEGLVASENLAAVENVSSAFAPRREMNRNYYEEARRIQEMMKHDHFYKTIKHQNPALFEASKDINKLEQLLRNFYTKFEEENNRLAELDRLAQLNPYDRDIQTQIEKEIRKKQIEEQLIRALEYNPEFFGVVTMLYIRIEVNKHLVKAFVDSGAQTTIMSKECATRCGLIDYMDTNHATIASGIGTGRILGRVHSSMLKIGNSFYEAAISIIEESKVEFLFGLDLLKRHRCLIDLGKNVLVIGEEEVPFFSDSEIREFGDGKSTEVDAVDQKGVVTCDIKNQVVVGNKDDHSVNEQKVMQLIGLGYSRDSAIEALRVCEGDVEMAAVYLMN